MQDAKPSHTAHRVALRRAAHQLMDRPPVFDDPLALSIIGAEAASGLRDQIASEEDRYARALRAFMSARSRYAEDQLAAAVAQGVRQYVVLGAGLDTFAYRNCHKEIGLRVFEVDHPATQAWKRELLSAARIGIPKEMAFVPVNFERQELGGELRSAGFRGEEPAFFSWLGVAIYLTHEAFSSTLRFVRSLPATSGVVFDYAVARSALSFQEQMALDVLTMRVSGAGEPFRLFFEPRVLRRELEEMGFEGTEDLGREEINARYFAGRADGLEVTNSIGRLLSAWVATKKP
jgi:methyltransferase (TIGR00027 family)